MDGGLGSCVLPALFVYSCGFNIIGGIIGVCYCGFYYFKALCKNDEEQKKYQLKNIGRWAVSIIPIAGPAIALLCMN